MKGKWLGLALVGLTLSSCVYPVDYDEDDYRPRERARAECVDEAHDRGYRRVEVQSVRPIERGIVEVTMHGRMSTGRDVRLSCEYNLRRRQASVSRAD